MKHRIGRSIAAIVAATAAILLSGSPAAAHVLLAKAQPNGDGSTTLTFTFDHGCGESPTTALVVSLPSGAATPTRTEQPTGWKATTETSRITWTGPGLQPGTEAAFSLVTRLTGTIGQALRFPTEQRCANGQSYQWTDPQPGDEHPAPSLIATGAILAPVPAATQRVASPTTGSGGADLPQALGALAIFIATVTTATAIAARRTRNFS
jgi:periplasmic copper chaperone A